jgi:hypothetical protein
MTLSLSLRDETFTIHRLQSNNEVPEEALNSSFFAVTRTDEELSLVLPESVKIESKKSESGWACFKVDGPLEFELVGILAGISTVLAEAGVSIFALSTFDTDYILVKREQVKAAKEALTSAGYQINTGEQ